MLSYSLNCRKTTESKNSNVANTNCTIYESKKSSGLFSRLGIKTYFSKIPLGGPLLYYGISKLIQGINLMK